jgi:hypothetical protein
MEPLKPFQTGSLRKDDFIFGRAFGSEPESNEAMLGEKTTMQ